MLKTRHSQALLCHIFCRRFQPQEFHWTSPTKSAVWNAHCPWMRPYHLQKFKPNILIGAHGDYSPMKFDSPFGVSGNDKSVNLHSFPSKPISLTWKSEILWKRHYGGGTGGKWTNFYRCLMMPVNPGDAVTYSVIPISSSLVDAWNLFRFGAGFSVLGLNE